MTLPGTFVTLTLLFVSLLAPPINGQESRPASPLTLEEVVQLHNAGFADDVIITRIRKNAKAFDLNTEELIELRKDGLSDAVVRFLLDPAQPYVEPPPPPPATKVSESRPHPEIKYPADENASKIPPEPGLYRFQENNLIRIDVKLLLTFTTGGGLGKLKKKESIAYLPGPAAKTRTKDQTPVFYLRLAEGKGIEEIVLVALNQKPERRVLDTGSAAAKQELNSEVVRSFESVEVAAQLFRLTTTKLTAGEYLFFEIASADPAKGISGKGFDFAIDATSTKTTSTKTKK
jgi:hypothetical protein